MKFIRVLIVAFTLALASWGAQASEDLVNINTATPQELATSINGVGLAKAEAIAAYREANGYFNSVDQLKNVKGIGDKTVEKLRGKVLLDVPLNHK